MLDAAAREVENFMRAARQMHFYSSQAMPEQQTANSAADESVVHWREIRRMVDLHIPGANWDFVVALVRHNRRPAPDGEEARDS